MSSDPIAIGTVRCPTCFAENPQGQSCWLCHSNIPANAERVPANSAPMPVPGITNPYAAPAMLEDSGQSTFPSIVLIVGLVVVLLALGTAAPGLAIMLAIVVAPALIRTAVVANRKRNAGEEISTMQKSGLFFASLAGVITACVAACAAFFIACSASCFGILAMESSGSSRAVQSIFPVAMFGSGALGLVAGFFVLRALWKRRK
ncbi:hypothetical protein Pla52n_56430 [Stieleria varia]|uniref:Uncharacterized protein n=1 Tax=Stieleria varia TaxID=2528005 RepID=A0A5C6A373_9BACT|nr:hypothetical protein Pla52n_56430 [Stieleria varia]